MKVKFTLSIGYSNARHEDIFEVDDTTTQEELDQQWEDWASNYIDGGAQIIVDDEE